MSLTQYLESQEDQDMTRLLNFTRTQERGRDGVFLCFGMEERGEVYIVVVEKYEKYVCLIIISNS